MGNRHPGPGINVCVDGTRRLTCPVVVAIGHVSRWSRGA
jgi:hypothetical protein